MMQESHYLVPMKHEGPAKDMECSMVLKTVDDAEDEFVNAKNRLLDVNSWNKLCPQVGAEFRLTDIHGLGLGRYARKGDLLRLSIPGVAGWEWMCIEAIQYDDYPDVSMESFAIRLQTVASPLDKNTGNGEGSGATFTFVIERRETKLFVSYHGRSVDDAMEALLGIPEPECEGLIKGILGQKN